MVALRYADGVVMAGDRRATEGHLIAHRAMEKVFPADRHSAVAIAGAAGPAVEMVRLFQTQLEHYEKVEGVALSLEGKANQLGQMVREHLPMAMQGLVVVPLFAGFDLRSGQGRIFTYDVTGGHYEEADHAATGSGGRDARTTIKLGWRADLARDDAIELAVRALYEAADEDSATGGPDLVRGIFPMVATVTVDGYERLADAEVAERFAAARARRSLARHRGRSAMTMPFYVAPEQVMKDRAEYAQKGIARGRSLVATVYDGGILMVAENPSRSLHKISEIYDRIAFAGVGKYNEFDQLRVAGVRHADTKGFAFSREDVDARSLANLYAQFLGQVFTHEMKPLEVEILVAELGADGKTDQLYHIAYEGTITDEDHFAVLGGETETITGPRGRAAYVDGWALDAALRGAVAASGRPRPDSRAPTTSKSPCWPGRNGRRAFRRLGLDELAERPGGTRAGARGARAPGASECAHRRRAGWVVAPPPDLRRRKRRGAGHLRLSVEPSTSSNNASTWSASRAPGLPRPGPTTTSTSTGPGRG